MSAERLGIRLADDVVLDPLGLVLDLRELLGQLGILDLLGVCQGSTHVLQSVAKTGLETLDDFLLLHAGNLAD